MRLWRTQAHENVVFSSHFPCAAFQGSCQLDHLFPGLTPWALLRHPFGVFPVVKCLALKGRDKREGQDSPGRKPWVEVRRSQALKGGTEIDELIGTVICPVFGAVVSRDAHYEVALPDYLFSNPPPAASGIGINLAGASLECGANLRIE
jgi:hypothetical protein